MGPCAPGPMRPGHSLIGPCPLPEGGTTLAPFRKVLEASGTIPINPEQFRTPKTALPYMNLILRTTSEPLVMSRIPSETPNKKTHKPIIQSILASRHVKCVTLRVREYADMIFYQIINSGVWKPILTPTHSSMIISDETRCQDSINPIYIFPSSRDILLARDLIVGTVIPSSISFTASTLLVS